jgi:hypothetical protein
MGSPIGLQAVRRSVQPSQSELALSQFMSMSHCMPGKNNETEPKRMDQTEGWIKLMLPVLLLRGRLVSLT